MSKAKSKIPYRSSIVILALALLAIYVLLPQLGSFQDSLRTIWNADLALILWAILFFAATYFAAAVSYCFIAYFKLRYWPTLLIQVADGFTNRIAPAGIGAVATNILYLIKQGKSGIKAGYIAGLNNVVGFVAHMLLLLGLLLFSNESLQGVELNIPRPNLYIALVLGAVVLTVLVFWRRIKKVTVKSYNYLVSALAASLKRPSRLLAGLVAAMLVTVLYALTLYAVLLSLNIHISFLQAFLVLTVSVIALSVTPTPGGIGGVEAGIVAALVAVGVASGPALSAALVYRLITYWLPIIPGSIALEVAVKRGYIAKP